MTVRDAEQQTSRTGGRPSPTAVLAVLIAVDVAFAFQQIAVIPAIPTVEHDLGAGQEWGTWLLSAYLMVTTAATPALARLADLHDRRTVLVWTLGVFLLGSIGAAVAPNIGVLVLSRAVQGFGGAVFPLSLSLARRHLPAERVTRGVSLLTAAFGAGSVLGFACGGVLAEYLSWRVIFAVGAVAIAAGAVLVLLRVPPGEERAGGRFDVPGTLLLGTAAIALLLALTLGVRSGWASWPVLLLFAGSAVAGVAWVRWELHHEDPIVDLRLFRNRAVVLVNVASLGYGWALFASYLLLPRLVQAVPRTAGYGLAAGAALTGFLLLPAAGLQTVAAPLAGRLARRWTSGPVLTAGLALLTGGVVVLLFTTDQLVLVLLGAALLGAGAGTAIQASSAVATTAVDSAVATVSAALNSTIRRFAGGVGAQVSTVLLAAAGGGHTPAHAGLVLAFAVSAGLALLGGVAAALVPR